MPIILLASRLLIGLQYKNYIMQLKRNLSVRKKATLAPTSTPTRIPTAETTASEDVLEKFSTHGVYLRKVVDLKSEIAAFKSNAKALESYHIKTPADLAKYFVLQRSGKARLVKNFKFRPSTCIIKGLAIKPYAPSRLGLIIDPTAKSTLATHFYKNNINSNRIVAGNCSLERPLGIKNVGSLKNLASKLHEKEKRRRGELWDNYNGNFGLEINDRNEVLEYFMPDGILCIELTPETDLKGAINFRRKIQALRENKERLIPFCKCDYKLGELELIPEATISEHLKSKKKYCTFLQKNKRPYPDLPENLEASLDMMDMSRLKNISSSLALHPPSETHPVTYEFSKKKLQCKTYVEAGMPLIKINRATFFANNNLLPTVACEHQTRQIAVCNALLKNKSLRKRLEVDNISMDFIGGDKNYLLLSYQGRKGLSPQTLLEDMGYNTGECKWKLEDEIHPGETKICLFVLQAIDPMVKKLRELTKLAELEVAPVEERALKRMRC